MYQMQFDDINDKSISILVPKTERYHYALKHDLTCRRCGKEIMVGSWYMKKRISNRKTGKTVYYHLCCWRDLWMDL